MKKYELIMFDFDGTIADTSEGILNCVRYVQKRMNLQEITLEQMYAHVGPPMEESYQRNFGLMGEDLITAVALHKEYAVKRGYKELRLYDGIDEVIRLLRKSHYKIAITTLKAQATVNKILDSLGIVSFFDYVLGTTGHTEKSELLSRCISIARCKEKDVVLVGDSKYDALAAENVGIDFIAVTYGFGFHDSNDADVFRHIAVCSNPMEILKYVK